jgi:hypothetical protein
MCEGVLLPLQNNSGVGLWALGGLRDALHSVCDVDMLEMPSNPPAAAAAAAPHRVLTKAS